MIQIKMLTFLGITYLLFIIGSTCFADVNVSKEPHCSQPIEYNMNISADVQSNTLNVKYRNKLNVTCIQKNMRVYFGRYCKVLSIIAETNNFYNYTPYSYWFSKLFSKFIDITLMEQYANGPKTEEREVNLKQGIYWIHGRYECELDKVTMLLPYTQTNDTKYLILPRIPVEWIFPWWDDPAINAKFTIQIEHNFTETALSHKLGHRFSKQNKFYTSFNISRVMSTHLVATMIVPSEYIDPVPLLNKTIMEVRFEIQNDTAYASSLITNITKCIRHKIENVIPASFVQYVVLPINSSYYETTVTTGLVVFRDVNIVYNREVDSIKRKREITCLIARSVIQEMFSNWLVMFNQSDSWFIEGFTTFYGIYLVDQIYHETLMKSIIVQTRREVFDSTQAFFEYDFTIQETPFLQNVTFSKMWREKAFNIFYMINNFFYNKDVLYNTIFEEAVNLYYTTTSRDTYNEQSDLHILWSNIMSTTYKKTFVETVNIIQFVIPSWITHIGYPMVQVKRNNYIQALDIMILDCFTDIEKNLCERKWWIPIIYVKISKNQSNTKHYVYLRPDEISAVIPYIKEEDFIIITSQNGYRVNYDRKSWKNIAFFLGNKTLDNLDLSDITLAHILDDALYFLIQNTKYNENPASDISDVDIFFNLTSNVVSLENSYITWYPIFTALQYMSTIFQFPGSANIKEKALRILNKFLENTRTLHKNFSENSASNQLYHEVLKWTCILDGLKCKEQVNAILKWHFENPTKRKLLPSWQKWIYCQGLMLENIHYDMSELWEKIRNIYVPRWKIREIFAFLPCSRQEYNILVFFRLLEDNLVKESDSVYSLFDIIAKHSKDVSSLNIIISEIQNTVPRYVSLLAVVSFSINHIYSDEGLKKITRTAVLLYTKLIDMYNKNKAHVILDAIIKKTEFRRKFLDTMHYNIRHKVYDVLNYKSMDK